MDTQTETTPKNSLGTSRVDGLKNPNVGVNPKDKVGASKVDLTLNPTTAAIQQALAQMDGATKYGPYNWRVEPIQTMTYLAAARRHIDSYLEGERTAKDSNIHHLGHVMACCAILIDAEAHRMLIDNRPVLGKGSVHIEEANAFIVQQKPAGWGR